MKNKLLANILCKLWYAAAGLFVLMAVGVTVARFVTPLLNENKPFFEHWAQKLLDEPVKIGQVKAWWQGFQPDIKIENVTILSKDHKKTVIYIKELRVDLSIIRSLIHWRLQPSNIEIWGVHLTVKQTSTKNFQVQGINDKSKRVQEKSLDYQDALEWLFAQPRLSLRQVRIDWLRPKKKSVRVFIRQLNFKSLLTKHELYGVITLFKRPPMDLHIGLEIKGDARRLDKARGVFYARLQNVKLSTWAKYLNHYGYKIQRGQFNGQIWLHWKHKTITAIQSLFDTQSLQLIGQQSKKPIQINRLAGNVYWSPIKNGWQLGVSDLQLNTDLLHWPKNQLYLAMQNSHLNRQTLWIDHIEIGDAQRLLFHSSLLDNRWRELIKGLKPSGELRNILIRHQGDIKNIGHPRIGAQLIDFSMRHYKKFPGIKNLSGMIAVAPNSGAFKIESRNLTLDFGQLFLKPILLNYTKADIRWRHHTDGSWQVTAEHFKGANDDLGLYGQMTFLLPKNLHNPLLSLVAGFHLDNTSIVKNYLPRTLIHQKALDWLDQAFPSGKGGEGTVILRGRMGHFPFDTREGTFIVDSKINTDLHYAHDWPNAKNINAHVIFQGRSMVCDATSGNFYKSKIAKLHAVIPEMHPKKPLVLNVQGKVVGDMSDMLDYLQHSPLAKSFGEDVSLMQLKGPGNLDLNIHMPLDKTEDTKIQGHLSLSDSVLSIPSWDLKADDLQGQIKFNEKGLSGGKLTTTLFDHPATVLIENMHELTDKPMTRISLENVVNIDDLEKNFKWPNVPFIQGEMRYHAVVYLHTAKGDTRQNLLSVSSDLKGVTLDLPPLLSKKPDDVLPFDMYFRFGTHQPSSALVRFGDKISTALLYHVVNKKLKLYSADLRLGGGEARLQKEKGLTIDGVIPEFDWQVWKNYLKQAQAKVAHQSGSGFHFSFRKFLRAIRVKIGRMKILGQQLSNSMIHVVTKPNAWQVGIDNVRIQGQVLIPENFPKGTLTGHFKRLYIQKIDALDDQKDKIDPGLVPTMNMQVDNFQYGDQNYGSINLITIQSNHLLTIKRLQMNSELLSTDVQGSWQLMSDKTYRSTLLGQLSSDNFTGLLKSFDINSSLLAKHAEAIVKLSWPDKILSFPIDKMSGTATLNYGSGRIVNLSSSTQSKLNMGRLLSLLSVNRLLMLNFSDLGGKGYGFDSMKGDFNLKSGHVTTNNLYFDGQVASISIKGSINLIKETLDLNLVITPKLTSSLPVIATIAGGPIAGAVTWIADKLIGKEVDKIKQYYYHVSGSFKKPKIKESKG